MVANSVSKSDRDLWRRFLLRQEVFGPFVIRDWVCSRYRNRSVGSRWQRFHSGGVFWKRFLTALCGDVTIWAQFQKWLVSSGLIVGLALDDFSIETNERIKKNFGSDVLKNVGAILGIQHDVWRTRRNKASKAVGAKNGTSFGFLDSDVKLGTVRQSVSEQGNVAYRSGFVFGLGDPDRLLVDNTSLGDLDIEWWRVEILAEGGRENGGLDTIPSIFGNGIQRGEIDGTGDPLPCLESDRGIRGTPRAGGYGAIVEGFDLEAEPMISAAVGQLERSAGEVRDADIHDEWLIGDIKRALECDIDLQLSRRYVQRQEKGRRCERETGQERASLKAKGALRSFTDK